MGCPPAEPCPPAPAEPILTRDRPAPRRTPVLALAPARSHRAAVAHSRRCLRFVSHAAPVTQPPRGLNGAIEYARGTQWRHRVPARTPDPAPGPASRPSARPRFPAPHLGPASRPLTTGPCSHTMLQHPRAPGNSRHRRRQRVRHSATKGANGGVVPPGETQPGPHHKGPCSHTRHQSPSSPGATTGQWRHRPSYGRPMAPPPTPAPPRPAPSPDAAPDPAPDPAPEPRPRRTTGPRRPRAPGRCTRAHPAARPPPPSPPAPAARPARQTRTPSPAGRSLPARPAGTPR
jgi:hypothetical protein